ncbi:MAG: phage tail tube protein [Pseudomonadota bacterium]|nr:phage tail tube protein [Pseudomonadota bacterium]
MAVGDNARFGYDSFVGISEETTYGTSADSFSYIEFSSESMKRNIEEIKLESINTSRDYIKRLRGNESIEGSLEFDLNVAADACVYLLKQAMGGTVATAVLYTTTSSGRGHTLNTGNMENNKSSSGSTDTVALTLEIQKGGNESTGTVWDFLGTRVNSISIKGEIGAPVVMTAELIGQTASTTSSTPTVTFTDINPCNFTGITINTGDSITNVSAETFIGFELTLNNNLISDTNARKLGSRTLQILPPARREVNLKLTQRFDTTTSYDRFIDNTMTAIQILLDSEQTIAANCSTYSMHINLPACYFNSNMPEIGDFGVVTHEVEVSAIKENTTTSYSIQMQINNATANY